MAPRKEKLVDLPILKRKLPMIHVETLPNGYSLTFDGMKNEGYMYFTPSKLLEGFMLHIGLNMTEELDIETMQDFIVAATQWNDNKKCLEEIKNLNDKIKLLESSRRSIANKAIIERNRLLTMRDGIEKLTIKFKNLKDVCTPLTTLIKNSVAMKPLTLKSLGVTGKYGQEPDDDEEDEE